MNRIQKIFLSIIGIGLAFLIAQGQSQLTFAQSANDIWFSPINISKSGGINNPAVFIDSHDVFHIVWQDIYGGYKYSYGDGRAWSEPQAIVFPFTDLETSYYFVTDSNERIHALWIDDEGDLYYARITIENFPTGIGWTTAQLLARSAIHLDIVTDQNDNIHLAYQRGASRFDTYPAGIYYQHFFKGNTNWSDLVTIDQSPYLRTINDEEANIDLATAAHGDFTTVYITWDNTPKRQVYLAQSDDTGTTWNIPFPIGNPPTHFNTPYDIQIQATGNQAMILWKQTEYSNTCSQQYLWTSDNGKTWQDPKLLFEIAYGCPQESFLFDTKDDFLLFTILNEQAYFLSWNGSDWSLPQHQSGLDNLADPETNLILNLHSLMPTLVGETLIVIGFDSLNTQDLWSSGHEINETASWYPQPSKWSEPQEIASENFEIGSTELVVDSLGRNHAFWNQHLADGAEKEISIFYSIRNGTQWSETVSVFGSQMRNAYLHSAAINSEDILFVIWESETPKGLYLSWVNADRAYYPPDWVTSDPLPTLQEYATSPVLVVDHTGNIIITFAIALNEDRGVYQIKSDDWGKTWAEPIQIADAVSMDWAMINNPQLSILQNGSMEALWTIYNLPPDERPLALYSSYIREGGSTDWSMGNRVTEGFIMWSQTNSVNNTYHRLWLESRNKILYLWHQYSNNNGFSWNEPSNMLTINGDIEALTSFVDPAKQLHLIFSSKDGTKYTNIHHWTWLNEQWKSNERLSLGKEIFLQPNSISSTASSDGTLGIIFSSGSFGTNSQNNIYQLYYSELVIDYPDISLSVTPMQTPVSTSTQPASTPTPTPTPTIELLPTQTITPIPIDTSSESTGNPWMGVIVGGTITLGFIVFAVSFGLFIQKRKK